MCTDSDEYTVKIDRKYVYIVYKIQIILQQQISNAVYGQP